MKADKRTEETKERREVFKELVIYEEAVARRWIGLQRISNTDQKQEGKSV